jgi:small-conductance mechanosensitive channel
MAASSPGRLINMALGAEKCNSDNRTRSRWGARQQETGERHHCDPSIIEGARSLSLGVSIFLLVVGAVLYFAVDVTTSGFSIDTVGIILMVAGALGLVLSLLFWSSFSPYRRGGTVVGGDTVVEERHIQRDLP